MAESNSSPPSIIQAVSVTLEGNLQNGEYSGTWKYVHEEAKSDDSAFPFLYKRSTNTSSLLPWQRALMRGWDIEEVLNIWDPQEDTPKYDISSLIQLDVTSLPSWCGAWEGHFILEKNGKETKVTEKFVLEPKFARERTTSSIENVKAKETERSIPLSNETSILEKDSTSSFQKQWEEDISTKNIISVVGGGANIYGKFQLHGYYNQTTLQLICDRSYVTMPRKKRKPSYTQTGAKEDGRQIEKVHRSSQRIKEEGHYNPKFFIGEEEDSQQSAKHTASHINSNASLKTAHSTSGTRKRKISSKLLNKDVIVDEQLEGFDTNNEDDRSVSRKTLVKQGTVKTPKSSNNKEPASSKKKASLASSQGGVRSFNQPLDDMELFHEEHHHLHPHEEDTRKDLWKSAFLDEENSQIYEGEMVDDRKEGYGIIVYCLFNNNMYEGEWLNNKEHGRGILMSANRDVIYDGDFHDGKMNGPNGTYYYSSGGVYFGDFRDNLRHGKGTYTLPSGCRYEGEWKDGLRHGKGVFEWPDGSIYDGDWIHDKRQGRGRLVLSGGLQYEGQFSNNLFDGRGVCVYEDGSNYEGIWKCGKKEGRGTLLFPNAASYEGRFRDDVIDGQGTLLIPTPVPVNSDKITASLNQQEQHDWMIPISFQSDIGRIHAKAGFDKAGL